MTAVVTTTAWPRRLGKQNIKRRCTGPASSVPASWAGRVPFHPWQSQMPESCGFHTRGMMQLSHSFGSAWRRVSCHSTGSAACKLSLCPKPTTEGQEGDAISEQPLPLAGLGLRTTVPALQWAQPDQLSLTVVHPSPSQCSGSQGCPHDKHLFPLAGTPQSPATLLA